MRSRKPAVARVRKTRRVTPQFQRSLLCLAVGQALVFSGSAFATYVPGTLINANDLAISVAGTGNYTPITTYSISPYARLSVDLAANAVLDAWIDAWDVRDTVTVTLAGGAVINAGYSAAIAAYAAASVTQTVNLQQAASIDGNFRGVALSANTYAGNVTIVQSIQLDAASVLVHSYEVQTTALDVSDVSSGGYGGYGGGSSVAVDFSLANGTVLGATTPSSTATGIGGSVYAGDNASASVALTGDSSISATSANGHAYAIKLVDFDTASITLDASAVAADGGYKSAAVAVDNPATVTVSLTNGAVVKANAPGTYQSYYFNPITYTSYYVTHYRGDALGIAANASGTATVSLANSSVAAAGDVAALAASLTGIGAKNATLDNSAVSATGSKPGSTATAFYAGGTDVGSNVAVILQNAATLDASSDGVAHGLHVEGGGAVSVSLDGASAIGAYAAKYAAYGVRVGNASSASIALAGASGVSAHDYGDGFARATAIGAFADAAATVALDGASQVLAVVAGYGGYGANGGAQPQAAVGVLFQDGATGAVTVAGDSAVIARDISGSYGGGAAAIQAIRVDDLGITVAGNPDLAGSSSVVAAYGGNGAAGILVAQDYYADQHATISLLDDSTVQAWGGTSAAGIDILRAARQAAAFVAAGGGYGGATISVDSAAVSAQAAAAADGILVDGVGATTVTLGNSANVAANATTGTARGVALANGGSAVLDASGAYTAVYATGAKLAAGMSAAANDDVSITLSGAAQTSAVSGNGDAYGIDVGSTGIVAIVLDTGGAAGATASGAGHTAAGVHVAGGDTVTLGLDHRASAHATGNDAADSFAILATDSGAVAISLLGNSVANADASLGGATGIGAAGLVSADIAASAGSRISAAALGNGSGNGAYAVTADDVGALVLALASGSAATARSNARDATGVDTYRGTSATVTLDGGSRIEAYSYTRDAAAVRADGTVNVDLSLARGSKLSAYSYYGNASGVDLAGSTSVRVALDGSRIAASSNDGAATGVGADSVGGLEVVLAGGASIDARSGGYDRQAVGVSSAGTNLAVVLAGASSITASGTDADGAAVRSSGGSVAVSLVEGSGFAATEDMYGFTGIDSIGASSLTVALDDATIDATEGHYRSFGIRASGTGSVAISLANGAAILADTDAPWSAAVEVDGNGSIDIDATSRIGGGRAATDASAAVLLGGHGTIALNNAGTIEGPGVAVATLVGFPGAGTINLVNTGSVLGDDFAAVGNVNIDNRGLVAGRMGYGVDIVQRASGTLQATLRTSTPEFSAGSAYWDVDSANLASGSAIRVGMTEALQVAIMASGTPHDYLMMKADIAAWDTAKLALSTEKFFTVKYMEGINRSEIGVTIAFDTAPAGVDADGRAALGALAGGGNLVFLLDGDPASWAPPSTALALDGPRGVSRLVTGSLRHRLDAVSGFSSGDETADSSVWVDARTMTSSQEESFAARGFDADGKAFTFGMDTRIEDTLVLGLAASRGTNDGTQANTANTIDSKGSLLSLYGTWHSGNTAVDVIGTVGSWANDSVRYAGAEQITAAYDSLQRGVSAIGRMGWGEGGVQLAPQLGFQYHTYEVNGYDEAGNGTPGSAALGVLQNRFDEGEVGVGASLSKAIAAAGGSTWTHAVELMVWHDVVGDTSATQAYFLAGSGTFVSGASQADADRIAASFSVEYRTENNLSVEFAADFDGTSDYLGQAWSAKFAYRY